jgi:hypothetical protein
VRTVNRDVDVVPGAGRPEVDGGVLPVVRSGHGYVHSIRSADAPNIFAGQ